MGRDLDRRAARHRATSRSARRRTTCSAATARARTSSATPCSRSTRAPASGSGTSRPSITISGTTTSPPAPKLLTVRHDGKTVDIVAQPTKFGLLYVFDRVTGEPLWPIEERPVPKSDVPGEESWPTQPFPTQAAAVRAAEVQRRRHQPVSRRGGAAQRLRGDLENARNEGVVHAADADARSDQRAGRARRIELGRQRRRSRRPACCTCGPPISRRFTGCGRRAWAGRRGSPAQRGRAVYQQFCEMLPRPTGSERHPLDGSCRAASRCSLSAPSGSAAHPRRTGHDAGVHRDDDLRRSSSTC